MIIFAAADDSKSDLTVSVFIVLKLQDYVGQLCFHFKLLGIASVYIISMHKSSTNAFYKH